MSSLASENRTVAAPWWRGAVVYQIYIRSFFDSNGDGQGDLPGVIAKLDYVSKLGPDAIWLSPIHPSPNCDWGYDVSDYDGVHPDYGSIVDFEQLIAQAHQRRLKVLLDAVLSHTSDQHSWFQESLSPDSKKADWYVWAAAQPDGTPPNNWLSTFGGPAWTYHPARRQYYHHKFLRQQPKLNWHHAGARAAALRVLVAWLARGADGFRLDVANSYLHDVSLADNPAVSLPERTPRHWARETNLQRHTHDANLGENASALDAIRRAVESFVDRFAFGEFFEDVERSGGYLPPDKGLHSGYTFELLQLNALTPDAIRDFYAQLERHPGYWPCISFSNHDVMRTVSRLGEAGAGPEFAKLALALLLALKGTVLLYQGEELGLPESELAREQLKDPVGIRYYPEHKGRDGCRTPMPWDGAAHALGFSTGSPWLPASAAHRPLSVVAQENDPQSPLNFVRAAMAARRGSTPLKLGEIAFLDAPTDVLVFERRHENESVLCVFNLGSAAATFRDKRIGGIRSPLLASGQVCSERDALSLGPLAAWIGKL